MRTNEAKQIPMTRLLAKLGHMPQHTKGRDVWYASPFRKEENPSFKVNTEWNSWYDFAEGKGGNILDFVMCYFHVSTISEALAELNRIEGIRGSEQSLPLFPQAPLTVSNPEHPIPVPNVETPSSGIQLKKVQPLQNKALIHYLEKRAIAPDVARLYVQEAYYTVTGRDRTYFALAFPNAMDGYELRNPYFKGVYGAKDISVLRGEKNADTVIVCEGFMDFLSLLCHNPVLKASYAVVLNSVALKDKARQNIQAMDGVANVSLYLDNDESGCSIAQWFTESLEDKVVTDYSGMYSKYKDVNEWWQNEHGLKRA